MMYKTVYLRICAFSFCYCFLFSESVVAQGFWYIFCPECTSLENNTHQIIDRGQPAQYSTKEELDLLTTLQEFERGLDPDIPKQSKIKPEIIGHGSTSIGFRIPGWKHLLIRRLPGFQSYSEAKDHIFLINEYRRRLHELSIHTTKTQLIALEDTHAYGVVYVVQPYLGDNQLAKHMFETYGDPFKKRLLKKQADIAETIISHNISSPTSAITVDIVSNNWEIVDFNPDTLTFDIRLNDIAQPLFKKNNKLTYDFYDQAFSIIDPLSWMIVRPEIQKQFSELFHPRNLLTQALWGYDQPEPFSLWQHLYYLLSWSQVPSSYPKWAMETVNSVLRTFNYSAINPQDALEAHKEDKNAIGCMNLYREATQNFRKKFRLTSNIYMNPGKTVTEMYAKKHTPGYAGCFWDAARDVLLELFYVEPSY